MAILENPFCKQPKLYIGVYFIERRNGKKMRGIKGLIDEFEVSVCLVKGFLERSSNWIDFLFMKGNFYRVIR